MTIARIREFSRRRVLAALAAVAPGCGLYGRRVARDIRYAPYDETALDVWHPHFKSGLNPAMLLLHGGGWQYGRKEEVGASLYLRQGFAVVAVEYRKLPRYFAPVAVEDAVAAADWVRRNGAAYGIDASRVGAAGPSAGGHLALMAAFAPEAPKTVRAVVNFWGPTDLVAMLGTGAEANRGVGEWIPAGPGRLELARRISPLWCVRPGLPPVLTIHGDADPLVNFAQAERLTEALRAAGDRAELIRVPGGGHPPVQPADLPPRVFTFLKETLLGRRS